MRRPLLILALLPATALAVPLMPFVDTPTFAGRATEVVIADCADPDVLGGPKDDGLTLVRVDVVRTLKGARKAGPARLATIGQPMEKGKRYLMVNFGGSSLGSDFVANATLGVVEVPAGFDLKALDGKTLPVQMQMVFDARRAEVTARLRRLEVEKAELDRSAVAGGDAPKAGPGAKAQPPGDLTKAVVVWSGRYPAAAPVTAPGQVASEVIGTDTAWERFWKARRGDEPAPRVDFGRSVVVVATWPGMAADSLHLGPCGGHRHAVYAGAWEGRIDGVGYVAGVFPRHGIADIEGRPLPR